MKKILESILMKNNEYIVDGNLSKKSLYKDVDFWNRTYENAKHSKLLIINHAYFLERVQDTEGFSESFEKNLDVYCQRNNVGEEVRKEISGALEKNND